MYSCYFAYIYELTITVVHYQMSCTLNITHIGQAVCKIRAELYLLVSDVRLLLA
jgi:hypothetical protein